MSRSSVACSQWHLNPSPHPPCYCSVANNPHHARERDAGRVGGGRMTDTGNAALKKRKEKEKPTPLGVTTGASKPRGSLRLVQHCIGISGFRVCQT